MNFSLLKKYCNKFYTKFFTLFVLACFAGISVVASPFLVGRIIDILSVESINFSMFYTLIGLYGGFVIISFIFSKMLQKKSSLFALEICDNMRKDAFEKLNYAKLNQMGQNSIGDLQATLVGDIEKAYSGLTVFFNLAFLSTLTIVAMLVMMIFINIYALILMFLMLPLAFLISKTISKYSRKYFTKEAKDMAEIYALGEEFLNNQKSAKLQNIGDKMQQNMEICNENYRKSSSNSQFFSALVNPTTRIVNNFIYVLLGLLGGILCLHKGLSVGSVSAFLGYAMSFAAPINNFTSVTAEILTVRSAIDRIKRVFNFKKEEDFGTEILDKIDDIQFENICFAYNPQKVIFDNFSLYVKKNSKVAIVGKTGSGKTTLVNLLLRFYELDSGRILINGKDYLQYDLKSLRDAFSMVLQETWLMQGTIRENLIFGNEEATQSQIDEVLQKTTLAKHSKKFAKGIDTIVGENDSLSQGQRQLITVARAMLCPAQNLILDEATSNVDIVTERQISQNFVQMMEGKTSFIIAHRLSTIQSCDTVVTVGQK